MTPQPPSVDAFGNFRLHLEDVLSRPLPSVGPYMDPAPAVDELCRNAHLTGFTSKRAFEDICNAQVSADLADINRFAFEGEGRVAGNHVKVSEAGKISDDVFRYSVSQAAIGLIPAEIIECQDGYRWLIRDGVLRARPDPPRAAGGQHHDKDGGGG